MSFHCTIIFWVNNSLVLLAQSAQVELKIAMNLQFMTYNIPNVVLSSFDMPCGTCRIAFSLFHPYFVVILKRNQAEKETNQHEDKNISNHSDCDYIAFFEQLQLFEKIWR